MSDKNTNLDTKGLNNMFNEKVETVQPVSRDMTSGDNKNIPGVQHQGVIVNDKYLVHDGPGYGKSSDSVITDTKNMSSNWEKGEKQSVTDDKTLDSITNDQIGKGTYNLLSNNCYQAQDNVMDHATRPSK